MADAVEQTSATMADGSPATQIMVEDGEAAPGWRDAVLSKRTYVDLVASDLQGHQALTMGQVDKSTWLRLSDWNLFF